MSSSKPTTPYSQREQGYREKALKMYPWVCGRCAREFSGKRLSELTVHHKDHNHDNNPEDGSNWVVESRAVLDRLLDPRAAAPFTVALESPGTDSEEE